MITYVDIGARGGIGQKWRGKSRSIQVHAFEPNPAEWEVLKKAIWWDGAKLYPYALWREATTLMLNVTRNPGLTSVYKPIRLSERCDVVNQVMVEAKTLDSFNIKPDVIKIDTQGSELDILMGAYESLDYATCVEVEMEFEPAYEGQPLFNDVNLFLVGRGFYLWQITGIRTMEGRVPFTDGIYFKHGSEDSRKRRFIEGVYNGC